jgi:hypothetical protein
MTRALMYGVIALVAASSAGAQVIHGIVRERAAGIPVPGATVQLLDSTGGTLNRAVTNERGEYRIARSPRVRQVRVVRMGFRPTVVAAPDAYDARLELRLTHLPTLLDAVATLDQPACPRRGDRPAAFALWEGARHALLAVVAARETDPPRVLRLDYHRVVGESRPGMISQLVHGEWARASRPYGSARSAADFVRDGFRDEASTQHTWFAPDADVLLEEDFALSYCLSLAPADSAHRGQAGLLFEPSSRARAGIRIRGTLWVDTVARQLATFEFSYLDLPGEQAALEPGGLVSFRTLPNGIPVIDRWHVRVPTSRRPSSRTRFVVEHGQARLASSDTGQRLEAHELGGELAHAKWPDSTEWRAQLATIRGRLLSGGVPLSNQDVWLLGTDYSGRTDSAGRFELTDVVPGRYAFSIPDSQLNALGLERTLAQHVVVARGESVDVDVDYPTVAAFIMAKCANRRGDTVTALLAGRVFDSAGQPVPAQIHVRMSPSAGRDFSSDVLWPQIYEARAGVPALFNEVYEGETGVDGLFYLCKLPPNRTFTVHAEHAGERGVVRFDSVTDPEGIRTVRVVLTPPR